MSIEDKELIETRFGPLWSGKTEIAFRGGVRTFREVRRALDMTDEDVMREEAQLTYGMDLDELRPTAPSSGQIGTSPGLRKAPATQQALPPGWTR